MGEFAQLTKQAFENYHNAPNEPAVWGLTDAFQHIVEYLAHDHAIEEMPGLPEALQALTPNEWATLRERYPEHGELIDSLAP
jgi:hypothetical protein